MISNRREFLVRTGQALGVLTLSGALTGCAGLTGDSGSGGGGASGTLTFGGTAEERKPLEAVLGAWDGADVRPRFTEVTQFNNALRTQLGSGSAPDVFRAAPGSGAPVAVQQIAPQGFLADLSDAPWADQVVESVKPLVQADGKTYALPVTITSIGVFYNKPVWAAADVEPPETLEDLFEASRRLKRRATPMALGLGTPTTGQFLVYALVASAVYAEDPDFDERLAAGDATFAGSGWRDALETVKRLVDEDLVTPNPNGTSLDVALQATAGGEAAMMVLPGVVSPALIALGEAEDIGAFPLPGASREATRIPASPSDTFAVNAEAGDVEEARRLVDFLAEDERISTFASTAACTPGLAVDGFEPAAVQAPLEALVSAGDSVPFMNHRWPNPDVQQVLLAGMQELVGGRTEPADLLAELDRAYTGS